MKKDQQQSSDKSKSKTVAILLLIQNAACDKRLSALSFRVFTRLLTHYNHKTEVCNPSEKTLMEVLDVSEISVWRSIKQLKDNGWITIEHKYRNSNQYNFNWNKAVKIDLRSRHLEPSSVMVLNWIENHHFGIQNHHLGNPEPSSVKSRTIILSDLEPSPVMDKPIEENLLKEPIEENLLNSERSKCCSASPNPSGSSSVKDKLFEPDSDPSDFNRKSAETKTTQGPELTLEPGSVFHTDSMGTRYYKDSNRKFIPFTNESQKTSSEPMAAPSGTLSHEEPKAYSPIPIVRSEIPIPLSAQVSDGDDFTNYFAAALH